MASRAAGEGRAGICRLASPVFPGAAEARGAKREPVQTVPCIRVSADSDIGAACLPASQPASQPWSCLLGIPWRCWAASKLTDTVTGTKCRKCDSAEVPLKVSASLAEPALGPWQRACLRRRDSAECLRLKPSASPPPATRPARPTPPHGHRAALAGGDRHRRVS